ncbi:TonB-dependent receptor [Microbulbifer bruguierae]|uniref:TonB-dependent receptor n=1 Tax=Microbulbifer bruguierae TaxID=3029061 RepID=A0ABY8ND45_9GAMM|nr:TonB-dependent receptor [Microbulbifer bruguierae]WGL16845.1 TonB-dependent receptor [Microbulbifer bruguierae]
MYKYNKHVLAAAIAIASSPVTVSAQEINESIQSIEEVVVTARRRSESLQKVPISISPVTSEQIKQRAYTGLEDIAASTSGFTYEGFSTSGTNGNAVIRGMAQTFTTARTQNVAFFLNGIHLQSQSMMNFGLVDMERVEVVKGPQSAMYGRNAFAGAVNYITSPATETFEANVETTLGDNERQDIKVSVSGPIIGDVLLGKLNIARTEYDGHTENDHPYADVDAPGPSTTGNVGGWDDQTVSATLELRPNEKLNFKLDYYRSEIERESQPYYVMTGLNNVAWGFSMYGDMNCNSVTRATNFGQSITGNSWWCGEVPTMPSSAAVNYGAGLGIPADTGHNAITIDPRSYGAVAETEVLSFKTSLEISDNASFEYLFGMTSNDSKTNGGSADRDPLAGVTAPWGVQVITPPFGAPIVIPQFAYVNSFSGRPISELESDSHELRLNFSGDSWEGAVGFFYSNISDESHEITLFMPLCSPFNAGVDYGISAEEACNLPADGSVPSPLAGASDQTSQRLAAWHGAQAAHTEYDDSIVAVFTELAYNLSEDFTLRGEMRYTEEDKSIVRLTDGNGIAPGGFAPSDIVIPEDQANFYYFTPRLTAEYRLNSDQFLYASAAMGVKSGGFNNTSDQNYLTYDEEQNWTYEVGSKNWLLDGALQLNAALYLIDWEDIQGSQAPQSGGLGDTTLVANIGDAESLGFEVDGRWLLGDHWSTDFALSWSDPTYDDDVTFEEGALYINYQCDESIETAPSTPTMCGNSDVGGNQLARTSEWQGSVGINYQTELFGDWSLRARLDSNYQSKQYITPLNLAYAGGRTITNANISLSSADHWRINLWGKNILDEEYVGGVFVLSQFSKMIVATGMGPSYGATISYDF